MPTRQLKPRALPWTTLLLGLLALLALPTTVAQALQYERTSILAGEVWRIWTAHFVHFGAVHFGWNLVLLLPAGCWVESRWPARTRLFYAFAPVFISALLLACDSALVRYAGLSGLVTGLLVLLACLQLKHGAGGSSWFWWFVLTLVAGKIGYELFTGAPLLLSGVEYADVRTVPLAHGSGAVAGGLAGLFGRVRG